MKVFEFKIWVAAETEAEAVSAAIELDIMSSAEFLHDEDDVYADDTGIDYVVQDGKVVPV